MKPLMLLAACLIAAGCDYTVPLASTPEEAINRNLVGLWEQQKTVHQPQRLLVLPLNAREYLVSFPAGDEGALFAKAFLITRSGLDLVQLEWIGTDAGKLPEDNRVYQVAAYSLDGSNLTVRMLNAQVVDKTIGTSAGLAAAIAKHKDDPGLFCDPMVFTKPKTGEKAK